MASKSEVRPFTYTTTRYETTSVGVGRLCAILTIVR